MKKLLKKTGVVVGLSARGAWDMVTGPLALKVALGAAVVNYIETKDISEAAERALKVYAGEAVAGAVLNVVGNTGYITERFEQIDIDEQIEKMNLKKETEEVMEGEE